MSSVSSGSSNSSGRSFAGNSLIGTIDGSPPTSHLLRARDSYFLGNEIRPVSPPRPERLSLELGSEVGSEESLNLAEFSQDVNQNEKYHQALYALRQPIYLRTCSSEELIQQWNIDQEQINKQGKSRVFDCQIFFTRAADNPNFPSYLLNNCFRYLMEPLHLAEREAYDNKYPLQQASSSIFGKVFRKTGASKDLQETHAEFFAKIMERQGIINAFKEISLDEMFEVMTSRGFCDKCFHVISHSLVQSKLIEFRDKGDFTNRNIILFLLPINISKDGQKGYFEDDILKKAISALNLSDIMKKVDSFAQAGMESPLLQERFRDIAENGEVSNAQEINFLFENTMVPENEFQIPVTPEGKAIDKVIRKLDVKSICVHVNARYLHDPRFQEKFRQAAHDPSLDQETLFLLYAHLKNENGDAEIPKGSGVDKVLQRLSWKDIKTNLSISTIKKDKRLFDIVQKGISESSLFPEDFLFAIKLLGKDALKLQNIKNFMQNIEWNTVTAVPPAFLKEEKFQKVLEGFANDPKLNISQLPFLITHYENALENENISGFIDKCDLGELILLNPQGDLLSRLKPKFEGHCKADTAEEKANILRRAMREKMSSLRRIQPNNPSPFGLFKLFLSPEQIKNDEKIQKMLKACSGSTRFLQDTIKYYKEFADGDDNSELVKVLMRVSSRRLRKLNLTFPNHSLILNVNAIKGKLYERLPKATDHIKEDIINTVKSEKDMIGHLSLEEIKNPGLFKFNEKRVGLVSYEQFINWLESEPYNPYSSDGKERLSLDLILESQLLGNPRLFKLEKDIDKPTE